MQPNINNNNNNNIKPFVYTMDQKKLIIDLSWAIQLFLSCAWSTIKTRRMVEIPSIFFCWPLSVEKKIFSMKIDKCKTTDYFIASYVSKR